jgi:hypothetical protein
VTPIRIRAVVASAGKEKTMPAIKIAAALAAAATTLSIAAPVSAAPLSTWYGTYRYEESLGRVGGDTPTDGPAVFVTRTLVLGPRAGASGCRLDAEGFQTYQKMLCTATPEGRSLVVKFYRTREPDQARYRIGEPLFRLTRTPAGLRTRLLGYRPTSDRSASAGTLFRRVR